MIYYGFLQKMSLMKLLSYNMTTLTVEYKNSENPQIKN